ncbi:MAG: DUF1302 domain-containing protein [Xanthomonadales bacterium]|nr:DUF1302 domain-containing protein [Xanthomonadales bacterium]
MQKINPTNELTTCTATGDSKMKANKTQYLRRAILAGLAASVMMTTSAQAFEFSSKSGKWWGSFDNYLSYGASMRVEERDDNNVAKSVFNPFISAFPPAAQEAARGRYSANADDGNLNYDKGDLITHVVKVTSELDIHYGDNFGGFFRASYFYDFENQGNDKLSDIAQEFVGSRLRMLDAYVYANWDIGDNPATIRVGRQVVSWGESTFIQGGINVINPIDVSALRLAGAELKEAFLPVDMVWGSFNLSENVTLEALYMFEFEQTDPDPAGAYFSGNDVATPGGNGLVLGFGLLPDIPATNVPRGPDNFAKDSGQYGVALRWFAPNLHNTEFGFYYLKYHSRLPYVSALAIQNTSAVSGSYVVEYPEGIDMFGISFNTTIGTWALQGEWSYRPDQPLQIDPVEIIFGYLSPLNPLIPQPGNRFYSQLGDYQVGDYIRGYEELGVNQLQFTLTKAFGPNNPFGADEWVLLGEFGATYVSNLPPESQLRFAGAGTDTGGGADQLTGMLRNPLTATKGFATDFSGGYRLITRIDYNSAFGTAFTLSPRVAFAHDVTGYAPGPGGNFVEGRKTATFGIAATYLNQWSADLSYTMLFGGGQQNVLSDRDFVAANIRYAF